MLHEVFRAPMRSRSDEVAVSAAVQWALDRGVVGIGIRGRPDEQDRIDARLQRFEAVEIGSFVWTRDGDGEAFVGRVTSPLRVEPGGDTYDLAHVRSCDWHDSPVPPDQVPAAVVETFSRGGRNFQRIRADGVDRQTDELWSRLRG